LGGLLEGVILMLFLPDEDGQGLTEYALLLMLVALVVILILYVMGPAIGNLYSNILTQVENVTG